MGKLTGGIDNDMIGRLGNHVGRRVKGENIIAMRPAKSNKPPTALQYDQRLKFGLATSWLSNALSVLNIGFKDQDAHMSLYNAAVKYNLEHAVTGVSPNFSINYLMAQFSQGVLRRPTDVTATSAAGAEMEYEWTSVIGQSYSAANDQIGLVVYNADKQEFVTLMNAALRSAQAYTLQLPLDWTGDAIHSWVLAVSANSKLVSNSAYVGQNVVV
jgi:hypothetical protein